MSYLNNDASFKSGQNDGINGVIGMLSRVIDGTDKGVQPVANKELEKVRRVFLVWRNFIIEQRVSNKKAMDVLLETKKIMDIVIPRN